MVATLLPATTWFLMHDEFAPARRFIERGIPVALATDFNPGTSPTASLPLVMTVACLELKLTPSEALAAVTINAATRSALARRGGLDRDRPARPTSSIWRAAASPRSLLAGRGPRRRVVKRGRVVLDRAYPRALGRPSACVTAARRRTAAP